MDLSNVSDAQLLAVLNAGPQTGNAAGDMSAQISAIKQNESSGASDARADIVNAASGARGSMQITPTGAGSSNPGFGVVPSNGTPQDDARTGRDYYAAMRQRYGTPDLAAIAYNWGPGNTDKWLANGGDLSKLPDETLKYVLNFKQQIGDTGQNVPGVTNNPIPAPSPSQDSSFLTKLGAGIGEGLGTTAAGVEALAGQGLSAIGADGIGGVLTKDAQRAKTNYANEAASYAGDSGWRTAGNIIGATAPMLFAGPELLPQIAAGGAYGASQGALNDTGILPGAVEGAGLGALGATLGAGAGKLISAGTSAVRPIISQAINAVRGGDAAATSRIAGALGGDLDSTIASLNANSNEIIPGSLPTAAEAGQNTQLVGIQRALQNTEQGQVAFTDRLNSNNAARWQAANAAVGSDLANEADAFTQEQAGRLAAGQSELPPLTQAQADVMQTPSYAQAMKNARALAENRGSADFEFQQAPLLQQLRQGIDDVAGTPETIDALKAARGQTADDLFGSADMSVPTSWPEYSALAEKPAFRQAMATAQTMSDNLGEGPIIAQEADGAGQWVSGRGLLYAKGVLDDQINRLLQQEQNAQARPIIAVRNQLVGLMDRASPDYAPARAQFQADTVPIDAQTALQARLNGTVDPLTGAVSPNKLRQTINSIAGEQLKPGARAADAVSAQTINQLRALGHQAQTTPTNLVGLSGEGQEYMRQALQDRVRASADTLAKREANQAASSYDAYLSQNSPSYADYLNQAATTGADIQSRQQLAAALEKLGIGAHNTAGDPILTLNGAKSLMPTSAPLTGQARSAAVDLISDLTRASAANNALGAAGSQTYANAQLGGGLMGQFMRGGALPTAGGVAGGFKGAAIGYVVKNAVAKANARTEKAAIDLLLNPKKLARALEDFKGQPQAKQVFIDTLKQKASGAGRAGVRAVQAYEAARTQQR
ncbi:lytic transglycosylase domain-containing protein [Paraburkholderia tropica]|uniref:lytic transglycosylase domain-containing protein n=1 Tax=Paraburkholderia tropica TaxID=92647 RepID=UPI003D29DA49